MVSDHEPRLLVLDVAETLAALVVGLVVVVGGAIAWTCALAVLGVLYS